jgi:PKD repeat protein
MKNNILLKTLLLFSLILVFFTKAFSYEFIISGHVIHESTYEYIPDHVVNFYSNEGTNFPSVETNENGFYTDTLEIEDGLVLTIGVQTFGLCQEEWESYDEIIESFPGEETVNLYICHETTTTNPDCLANFIYFPNSISGDMIFHSTSIGDVTEWCWDFGDGNSSNDPDPTHTYEEEGVYTVCLTITAADKCEDTYCEEVIFTPISVCQAFFYCENDGPSGYEITFIDMSNGEVTNWFWDFGDGSTSTNPSPIHVYDSSGTYHVCLTIGTEDNCSSSFCNFIYVSDTTNFQQCLAYFIYEGNIPGGEAGRFLDFSVGRNIIEWSWDFGDDSTSTEQYPVHHYNQEGEYNVCLRIKTLDDCEKSYCRDIYYTAEPNACQADFYNTPPTVGNQCLFFDASSGDINSWFWDFGDGEVSYEPNPVQIFEESGLYKVCLSIETDYCESTFCKDISVGETYSLSGEVFAGDNLLPEGDIYLIEKRSGDNYMVMNSAKITDGSYFIDQIFAGTYILYAVPEWDFIFNYFPKYFPTYFGDEIFWNNATPIEPNKEKTGTDIQLVSYDTTAYGPAYVNGNISGIFHTTLPTIPVLLLDINDNPVDCFLTTTYNSFFEFNNIEYGTYKIYPEVAGFSTYPLIFNLSEENPEVTGINFALSPGQIAVGLEENNVEEQLNQVEIFPNPTSKLLNLKIQKTAQKQIHINIFNNLGQVVYYYSNNQIDNSELISLNISDLPTGIYFLRCRINNEQVETVKFIKTN